MSNQKKPAFRALIEQQKLQKLSDPINKAIREYDNTVAQFTPAIEALESELKENDTLSDSDQKDLDTWKEMIKNEDEAIVKRINSYIKNAPLHNDRAQKMKEGREKSAAAKAAGTKPAAATPPAKVEPAGQQNNEGNGAAGQTGTGSGTGAATPAAATPPPPPPPPKPAGNKEEDGYTPAEEIPNTEKKGVSLLGALGIIVLAIGAIVGFKYVKKN